MNDSDLEVSRLLEDALDAPPVPSSLLERLDQAIEEQWGESPELTPSQRSLWERLSGGKSGIVGWSLAACLSIVVSGAFLLMTNREAFAWPDVLKSLGQQNIVVLETTASSDGAWMSVPVGIVAHGHADQRAQLVDFPQQVVLQRQNSEPTIHRVQVRHDRTMEQFERQVLHFFLGRGTSSDPVPHRKVTGQQFRKTEDKRELILEVEESERKVDLVFVLDENALPTAYRIIPDQGEPSSLLSLQYENDADDSGDVWIAEHFPDNMSIIDAQLAASDQTASPVTDLNTTDQATQGAAASGQVAIGDTDPTEQPAPAPVEPQDDGNPPNGTPGPGDLATGDAPTKPPTGAASLSWDPVAAVELSSQEVIAEANTALEKLWKDFGVEPAPPASEYELLRRVYLDLVGRPPSVNESRSYFKEGSDKRYESLVDRLLNSRDHATHLATTWRRFLLPEGVDLSDFGGIEAFDRWLADQFANNEPYSEVASRLLLAEGRLSRSGPLLFYSAAKLDADQLASRSARVFLGMRLECAQCHDDPFEPWTQNDFWSYAAFFARISRPQGKLETVSSIMRVRDIQRGEVKLPDTETVVAPSYLDGSPYREQDETSRRQQLTDWLVSKKNPYFARATVNRVWAQLFGRGIVDPVDGFGKTNPPVSPELLDLLAGHFVHADYDLRELLRTIVLTDAYQLSSGATANHQQSEERQRLFAQMNIKMLTAEQMYDGIVVASMLGSDTAVDLQRMGNAPRDAFLAQFRTPGGLSTDYQGGIPQALTLMNGTLIQNATGLQTSGLLESLNAPFYTDQQRVEVIYLATLARKPSPREWQILQAYLKDTGQQRTEVLADVLWALLNSAEFSMNH